MADPSSTHDANARRSEVLGTLESGRTVRISQSGEATLAIGPFRPLPSRLADRIEALTATDALTTVVDPRATLRPVAVRSGALDRFLADRVDR